MERCVNALKEWTGKESATIVYDSVVDEFTADGLFNKVGGKPNIAVVGITTDGDVFGGFYSVAVTKQDDRFYDQNVFVFSFESHGRCMTPQRFAVKEGKKKDANVKFWENDFNGFVVFGVYWAGNFWLGNERSDSDCNNMSRCFEGLEDITLTGMNGTWNHGPYHHCTRLIAIQLE